MQCFKEDEDLLLCEQFADKKIFWRFSNCPYLVLPLSIEQRRRHLYWCRERQNWNNEWRNLVFHDELGMHNRQSRVRRRCETERHLAYGSKLSLV